MLYAFTLKLYLILLYEVKIDLSLHTFFIIVRVKLSRDHSNYEINARISLKKTISHQFSQIAFHRTLDFLRHWRPIFLWRSVCGNLSFGTTNQRQYIGSNDVTRL